MCDKVADEVGKREGIPSRGKIAVPKAVLPRFFAILSVPKALSVPFPGLLQSVRASADARTRTRAKTRTAKATS